MKITGAITFTASEREARENIRTVIRGLGAQGIGTETLGSVQIALAEAVNNIVEHAYGNRQSGQVRLTYEIAEHELTLRLEDDGRPFAEDALPDGVPANVDVPLDEMPEGGFGWFLIRTLTQRLTYSRKENTNRLALVFSLE